MHPLKLKILVDGVKCRLKLAKEKIGNSAENFTQNSAQREGNYEREVKSHE